MGAVLDFLKPVRKKNVKDCLENITTLQSVVCTIGVLSGSWKKWSVGSAEVLSVRYYVAASASKKTMLSVLASSPLMKPRKP